MTDRDRGHDPGIREEPGKHPHHYEAPELHPPTMTADEAIAIVDGWGPEQQFGLHTIARALRAEVERLRADEGWAATAAQLRNWINDTPRARKEWIRTQLRKEVAIMALADRREALCRMRLECLGCGSQQVQLLDWWSRPAKWRCRQCRMHLEADL